MGVSDVKDKMRPSRIEQDGNVISLYFEVKGGWKQRFALFSDVHKDSVYCDEKLYKKHLDKMMEDDAIGLWNGDLLDCMQGPRDPRFSLKELKTQYKTGAYFDAVVDDAVKFHKPYANNIAMFGMGNHELTVMKFYGSNILQRISDRLNYETNSNIKIGGFAGWVRIMLVTEKNVPRGSVSIRYYHGGGAEAPVTKGAIEAERQAAYIDSDIVWNGHNHGGYTIPTKRERLTNKGKVIRDIQWFLRTPGYKQPETDEEGIVWDITSGKRPKPRGMIWLDIEYYGEKIIVQPTMAIE